MSKIPYFPFYPDDWLSSPRITTSDYEDRGLYIHLLCQTWNHPGCQLPNDRAYLMRLCPGARWKRIEKVLQNFFNLTEICSTFYWRNDRLSVEFSKSLDKHSKAKESANYRWNKNNDNADAMRTQCEGICERNANQNQNQNHIKSKDKSIVDRTAKRFIPPDLKEVMEYCIERKNKVDAQKFIDHYTSNGWRVGKNPMKDWKAAVRTWEKNNYAGSQNGGSGGISAAERREQERKASDARIRAKLGIGGGSAGPPGKKIIDITPRRSEGAVGQGVVACVGEKVDAGGE